MEDNKYKFQCKVEIGMHNTDHDVYITYNGSQWSGFQCRTIEDLRKVRNEISKYLYNHRHVS